MHGTCHMNPYPYSYSSKSLIFSATAIATISVHHTVLFLLSPPTRLMPHTSLVHYFMISINFPYSVTLSTLHISMQALLVCLLFLTLIQLSNLQHTSHNLHPPGTLPSTTTFTLASTKKIVRHFSIISTTHIHS